MNANKVITEAADYGYIVTTTDREGKVAVLTFEASGQIVASCRWVGGRFEGGYTIHHGYTHSWRTLKDMRMGLGVAAAERKMGPFAA